MDAQQIVASNSNANVVHALATLTTVCGVASFRKANARQLESARRCATCFPTAETPAPKATSRKAAKKVAAPVASVAAPAETPAPAAPAAPVQEDGEPWTWRLSFEQVEATRAKFAKLNERAAKKGMGGSWELTNVERVVKTDIHPATGLPVEEVWYECTVGGTAIAFDGWEFIATLDWDEYAGLIVRAMPGAVAVEREGLREGWCDHCATTRRRRVTYVVRDTDNGQQLQVGRSCIKDFTGWQGSIAWLEKNNIGEGFFGDAGRIDYTPATVLATAWAVIKLNGFVPASHYGETTTKDLVNIALYPNRKNKRDMDFAERLRPLAQEAMARAGDVLEFIASDDFSGPGDYVPNLKAAAAGERVSPRNFGLVVSAPQAHARHLERTLVRQTRAKIGENSEYVGRVAAEGEKADRRELEVTVAGIFWRDNPYGGEDDQSPIYTLVDGDGNLFKWFASTDKLGEDEGARFVVKASIKAHKEWKGTKETHVARVTVVKELEPLTAE
jgi:hypothetical protein